MLEISNVKVNNLREAVVASGNAMRLEPVEVTDEEFEKGLVRMKKLIKASRSGDVRCHDNALVGINVYFTVKYPQYWTPEFQRYHFADIVTSSSKMHRLLKMDIDKSCNKYVTKEVKDTLKKYIEEYNRLESIPSSEDLVVQLNLQWAKYQAWMKVLSNTPLGLELFMDVTTNYKQLQTIYHQRKNHKLKEDWGAFCKMIEGLPYFNELILGE